MKKVSMVEQNYCAGCHSAPAFIDGSHGHGIASLPPCGRYVRKRRSREAQSLRGSSTATEVETKLSLAARSFSAKARPNGNMIMHPVWGNVQLRGETRHDIRALAALAIFQQRSEAKATRTNACQDVSAVAL